MQIFKDLQRSLKVFHQGYAPPGTDFPARLGPMVTYEDCPKTDLVGVLPMSELIDEIKFGRIPANNFDYSTHLSK